MSSPTVLTLLQGVSESCCDDTESAKYQPLELVHGLLHLHLRLHLHLHLLLHLLLHLHLHLHLPGDRIFYCYFERVAERRLWLFFVRNYGPEEVIVTWPSPGVIFTWLPGHLTTWPQSGSEWSTTIWVGGGCLARGDRHLASHVYRGKVGHLSSPTSHLPPGRWLPTR